MTRFAIAVLLSLSGALAADPPEDALRVLFTGRLMGYFRIPDRQTSPSFVCRDGLYSQSPQVAELRSKLRTMAGAGPHLTLGLGDNFSPDLWSRFIYENDTPKRKDVLDAKDVDSDNVACFLGLAGYDAVVPGKHDFYFGPERLRQYARFLARGPAQTAMLGANLAIVTASVLPAKKLPPPSNQIKMDLPDIVFPWMQNFTVEAAYDLLEDVTPGPDSAKKRALTDFSLQAVIKSAGKDQLKVLDNGAYSYIRIKWTLQNPCVVQVGGATPAGCNAPGAYKLLMNAEGLLDRHPDGTAVASLPFPPGPRPTMLPPARYRFLADAVNAKGPSYYDFTVQWPFFQAFGPDPSQWTEPYLLKEVGGQRAAIFGVVDGALKEHVGLLNYSWQNRNHDLDTQLAVADPAAALDQVMQYCLAAPKCHDARRILLAQMPYEQAQLLAGKFRLVRTSRTKRSLGFELVLAQTDDRHAAVDQTRSQAAIAPFVLSPGQIFDNDDPKRLHVRVYRADLGLSTDHEKLDLTLTSNQNTVPLDEEYAGNKSAAPLPNISHKDLQTKALEAMRERRNADIAMLQKRDLFELPNSARKGSWQEQLDTIFWKGDFVVQVDVTGAQLKSVMDQSHQFDQADANTLDSGMEAGRGLVTLGVWQDDDKNWVVNGAVIDPTRLYSVATTDYLAFGDTGYTGLRPATLPRIARLELVPLSSLVCSRVPPVSPNERCADLTLDAGNYFDQTTVAALDNEPAAGVFDDLAKWIHVTSAAKPKDLAEDRAQNHTFWSITLEKADIGYSFYHHLPASQVQLRSEFAGVPQAQVLASNTIAISSDYRLRIVRSGRRWDRYLLAEEAYEHDVKQANDDTRADSQAANMIGFESGLNYRIVPDGRRLPAVKLLGSLRVETNPLRPLASFSLKSGVLVRPVDRLVRFPAKIGVRVENKVSWLEFGYQISKNLHSPVGYEFLDPNTQAVLATCGATSAQQTSALATCVSNSSDPSQTATPITAASGVAAITQTRWQHGIFLNFKLDAPLLSKDPYSVHYVMENTGNLYFHYFNQPDYSLDTRRLDTWTHSLLFKLPGNFSIAPKVQYLFYQNMVDNSHMHSISTSVSLQYSFAWHSGMRWKNALTYADPNLKPSK